MPSNVYLDNHTITKPLPAVLERYLFFLKNQWGALSSCQGEELFLQGKKAFDHLTSLLGVTEQECTVFRGAESDALFHFFFSYYFDHMRESGKNHFLITPLAEAAVVLSMNLLEKMGCVAKPISLTAEGKVDVHRLQEALRPRTALFSIPWASGLTGVIQPVEEIGVVCKEKGVFFHLDGSAALGKLFFQFEHLPCDALSLAGDKIHALKNSSLFLLKRQKLSPSFGIPNPQLDVAALVAFECAVQEVCSRLDFMGTEIARLRTKLEEGVLSFLPDAVVCFKEVERVPNVSALSFPGAMSEALLFLLKQKGVHATLGGGSLPRLDHILKASHFSEEVAECALSFNLSYETTEQEIDYTLEQLEKSVKQLKRVFRN